MTHLDEKELAAKAWADLEMATNATGALAVARVTLAIEKVRALAAERVSALPSSPVSELVDVTQPIDDIYVRDGFCDWADVANARDEVRNLHASTLTSLSTRNAELEREVKRLRGALADMIGHAKWAAAEFDIHYSHLARCEAALSTSPQGGEHE